VQKPAKNGFLASWLLGFLGGWLFVQSTRGWAGLRGLILLQKRVMDFSLNKNWTKVYDFTYPFLKEK
jgi:hypothetical protein